jgi:site-specific DNA recombinase
MSRKQAEKEQVNVAAYVRVSLREQAEEGHSLAAQRRAVKDAAEVRGWRLVEVYEDAGATGGNLERPGLQALLEGAKAGHFQAVIITSLDRLSRRSRDLHQLAGQLEDMGVGLVCLRESLDSTGPVGKLIFALVGGVAEFERDLLRERTRNGMEQAKREGRVAGRVPFGWRREGKLLVKHDEEQKALAKAKRLRRQGKSLRQVAALMNWGLTATAYRLGWRPQSSKR